MNTALASAITAEIKHKRISLNIYLLKAHPALQKHRLWSDKDFLASPVDRSGKSRQIKVASYLLGPNGEFGTLYIRRPITETEPEWLGFVRKGLEDSTPLEKLKNRSVSAILVIEQNHRQFVLAFGHGRHMIEPLLIEDRFGIRVVLNSISPDKVASIDRQTFDATPKLSRVQTVKASSVSDFMINPEQDLLRGLVGFTKTEYKATLGDLVAGIDSFKTSVPIDLSGLSELLKTALERSHSKDYLTPDSQGNHSQFAWVENLLPVKNKELIDKLDEALWEQISSRSLENKWLAIPEIVDWSQITGFQYGPSEELSNIHANLDLSRFLDTLKAGATLDTIKRREIFMVTAGGAPAQRFTAFKCIYAEIKSGIELFILHVGTWFKVEANFQSSVEKYFSDLKRKKFHYPFIEYEHDGEGKYNDAVCLNEPASYGRLDRRLIRFGGTYDKIEVCDVLRIPKVDATSGFEFIHVKRGRSSATLSHLFAQGLVASTLLVREKNFVKEVNKQLSKFGLSMLPDKFSATGNEVVFAIVDGKAGAKLDIPFFSKVTLQNCCKSIVAFGYSVSIMHIPESLAHLEKVQLKAKEKKAKKTSEKKAVKKSKSRIPNSEKSKSIEE